MTQVCTQASANRAAWWDRSEQGWFPDPTVPFFHRHRVIQPMGMSPRGQLTSLQDAMCETMAGQLSSDPDSDPD